MYIKRIILKNIRGFEELDFDLTRSDGSYAGWTVFTGDNGSGKSTLIKAIAIGLTGKDTARALQPSFHRWIRDGADHEASIQLEIVRRRDDDSLTDSGRGPIDQFPAKIVFQKVGKETTLQIGIPKKKPKTYSTPERTIWSLDAKGWFACGYGPFRRVFGASPDATRQMVAPITERFVTIFQEAASLAEMDQWLRTLNHKALENKTVEVEQLKLLIDIISDDFLPSQITVDRVDSDGLWLKDNNGVLLAWSEMSDGYRAALALLADIFRHLINAYGIDVLIDKKDTKCKNVVKPSGIVLIDGVDAHLHPEWQQKIGFWLKRHFPNIQFLVTTHSPIICQEADDNGLFVLSEPASKTRPRALTSEEYKKVISSRPDTILLTPAFGLQNTRSLRAVEGRAEFAKLQAKRCAGAQLTQEEEGLSKQLELFSKYIEEIEN
jgi:energy-coupling factor transporter ATP-binding protein EcfA2